MKESRKITKQTVICLPYFNEEVPVLHLENGKAYVPIIALCNMFGLHANTHIRKWRKLFLWAHAQKLPFHTITGQKRIVWCLHRGAIPLWCGCFDWSLVSPERQEQLHQATEAWSEVLNQAHLDMLSRYKQMRCILFEFLTAYKDTGTALSRLAVRLHPILDEFDLCIQLEEIVAQGQNLIHEATDHARWMVQGQATDPIIDAVKIDKSDQVIEELSLPLFPFFGKEDCQKFFDYEAQLSSWYQTFVAFLRAHDVLL